jgi:hypothetical protein
MVGGEVVRVQEEADPAARLVADGRALGVARRNGQDE